MVYREGHGERSLRGRVDRSQPGVVIVRRRGGDVIIPNHRVVHIRLAPVDPDETGARET